MIVCTNNRLGGPLHYLHSVRCSIIFLRLHVVGIYPQLDFHVHLPTTFLLYLDQNAVALGWFDNDKTTIINLLRYMRYLQRIFGLGKRKYKHKPKPRSRRACMEHYFSIIVTHLPAGWIMRVGGLKKCKFM